jgi:D-glycero-alpha-D-manno-heptose 1-phosphate guanylyltransferase
MFEAVILAGGFGTRLKSVSGDTPKPMVHVGEEPFLYKLMKLLESSGCNRIVLSLYYQAEYIRERILADKPVKCAVDFAIEKEPLGTGGAIKFASNSINAKKFIVVNGDSYCNIDYADFYKKGLNYDVTILAVKVSCVGRYGSLNIDVKHNIVGFNEKGDIGSGFINGGAYVLDKEIVSAMKQSHFSIESDFFPGFTGSKYAYFTDALFVDIGVPQDYKFACENL